MYRSEFQQMHIEVQSQENQDLEEFYHLKNFSLLCTPVRSTLSPTPVRSAPSHFLATTNLFLVPMILPFLK